MYHHFILTREDKETIYKIYLNQKQKAIKGDWFQLLKEDFTFIGIEMNEKKIMNTPK